METDEYIDTFDAINRHKICVVGMNGTGKKSFISKFNSDLPFHNDPLKVSVTKNKKIGDDLYIFDFWNFNNISLTTKKHYADATVIFVVIDNRPITLDIARLFKKDINAKYDSPEFYELINPIILLVNKTDLLDEKTKSELNYDDFCTEYGFSRWIPISTKTEEGIDLAYGDMFDICKCFACLQRPSKLPEISSPKENLLVESKLQISKFPVLRDSAPIFGPDITKDKFREAILCLYSNKFDTDPAEAVMVLKSILATIYFDPNMGLVRNKVSKTKNLHRMVLYMHNILIEMNSDSDAIKIKKILNSMIHNGQIYYNGPK